MRARKSAQRGAAIVVQPNSTITSMVTEAGVYFAALQMRVDRCEVVSINSSCSVSL